jgi:hypothetical protein
MWVYVLWDFLLSLLLLSGCQCIPSPFTCCCPPRASKCLSSTLLTVHIGYLFPYFHFSKTYFEKMMSVFQSEAVKNKYFFTPIKRCFILESIFAKNILLFLSSLWNQTDLSSNGAVSFVLRVKFGQVFFPSKNIMYIKNLYSFLFF